MEDKCIKMENLKKLREQKGLTQIRLSTEVGVSQEHISHLEIRRF